MMFAATPTRRLPARPPATRRWQRVATLAVLLGSLAGVGCGSLPQHVVRQPSWSLPAAEDLPLARLVQASTPPQQAQQSASGCWPMAPTHSPQGWPWSTARAARWTCSTS